MIMALSQWRSIRKGSVVSPRSDQPGIEGADRAAQMDQCLLAQAMDAFSGSDDDTAQGVPVAIQVFGRAMDDIIRAHRQGSLQAGPAKVESTASRASAWCAILANASMSAMRRMGLAGVST